MAPLTPQKARTAFQAELSLQPLKNCLVNLPGPLVTMLVNNNVVVQDVVAELQYTLKPQAGAKKKDKPIQQSIHVGWTGMQSKRKTIPVIGAGRTPTKEREVLTVELDSTFASTLGLTDRMNVSREGKHLQAVD
jgi:peroxin-1